MLLDCRTRLGGHAIVFIISGVRRAGFHCSYFAPDIVKFACSRVKCPNFLFFGNNYDPHFTVLF